ncbi:MAG: DUF2878 domain-containing protein, partial [Betaproteobacteria bacterium]|nr:DUF2878 domain-containing protein [Betaproteobacteria bacterium]
MAATLAPVLHGLRGSVRPRRRPAVVGQPLPVRSSRGLKGRVFVATRSAVAVNFLLFQAGWFACVLGAARGFPWQGALVALLIAAFIVFRSRNPRDELSLVLVAALIGFAFDSVLALTGWLSFAGAVPLPALAPVWMVSL